MKLALISRDGILNQMRSGGVTHRTALSLLADNIQALSDLSNAGYTIIVLTHQPGLSRGLFDLDELEAIHQQIVSAVEQHGGEITAIFYCPHDEQDNCYCRPPNNGLLEAIEMEFDVDTAQANYFLVTSDEAQMANARGCRTFVCEADTNDFSVAVTQLIASEKNI